MSLVQRARLWSIGVLALLLATVAAPFGRAAVAAPPVYQLPLSYYLALGDSMTYGFQPTKAKPGAQASDFSTGYVDVFAARLRGLSPKLRVVNYGCPGESTVTFAHGGWRCDGAKLHDAFHGSQLKAAVAFLRAHPGEVSPITVSLWGNDLVPLSLQGKRSPSDVAAFETRFASILRQLRAAAPAAEIVVIGAWNPEADHLGKAESFYRSADAAITRAAAASRVRVANMFATLDGGGSAKAQHARLCRLTFYCSAGARGDPHPTDAGYRAMAGAFLAASGYPSK